MDLLSEIQKNAELARLELGEDEVKRLEVEIAELLENFKVLESVEAGQEAHFLQGSSPVREDFSSKSEAVEAIMEQVAFKRGRFVKVPKGLKK